MGVFRGYKYWNLIAVIFFALIISLGMLKVEMNTYERLTAEELLKEIRSHNQIQIYTVYEEWYIQLFDLSICPNDINASCNWEDSDKDLKKVLIRAVEHIVED